MTKKNIYFENLDGLRFLCFLSVFLFHSFHTELDFIKNDSVYHFIKRDVFGNGNIGVNFFFVLSGFLITYLLLEEKETTGNISLGKFWIRRILRIWPLFYFCVFFGFIIFPFLKQLFGQTPNETANPIFYITFLNNFDFISKGLPDASVLGVLWSVAIEEQFYVVWPIIIYLFPTKKLWMVFILIITSSLIFRAIYDSPIIHEHHTISCIGDMTTGALGAWLIYYSSSFKKIIVSLTRFQVISIYTLFIFIFLFRQDFLYANHSIRIFERLIIAIIIILIILEQTYSEKSFFKLSNFKTISSLGIITYGLYCLHFIGILIVTKTTNKLSINTNIWEVLIFETFASLIVTIIISKISYRYYESHFLKFKERFSMFTRNKIA